MSQLEVFSIERQNCQSSVPDWAAALTTHIGRLPPAQDQELSCCKPTPQRGFSGRLDVAALDHAVLSKVAATPNVFSHLLTIPGNPVAAQVMSQLSGSCRVEQAGRSSTLRPGDWCLLNAAQPFNVWSLDERNECLMLTVDRPSDPECRDLLQQAAARRFSAGLGLSRILQATLMETFNQINRLHAHSRSSLERALVGIAWDAVREHLAAPLPALHRDGARTRIKTYVEAHLSDPALSVEAIARACAMSVRSAQRAFEADPAGSISNYIWLRRLSRCADTLRDPAHTHRSITDICFSYGFNSTSHFSRLFKEQFGLPPREYRTASEDSSLTPVFAG
jgi:AraC-like DNA-binding protein